MGSRKKKQLKEVSKRQQNTFYRARPGNLDKLEKQLSGQQFDYVVHAAGVTKCLHSSDFFKVNTEGTANLALALRRQNTG